MRDLRLHWISHARRCGLLKGYEATTHWGWHEILSSLGVKPVQKRVVRDRNRLSGGGVTAGLDFGLKLLAILGGEEAARTVQLLMEYDPATIQRWESREGRACSGRKRPTDTQGSCRVQAHD